MGSSSRAVSLLAVLVALDAYVCKNGGDDSKTFDQVYRDPARFGDLSALAQFVATHAGFVGAWLNSVSGIGNSPEESRALVEALGARQFEFSR